MRCARTENESNHAQSNFSPSTLRFDPSLLANLTEPSPRPVGLAPLLVEFSPELLILLGERGQ